MCLRLIWSSSASSRPLLLLGKSGASLVHWRATTVSAIVSAHSARFGDWVIAFFSCCRECWSSSNLENEWCLNQCLSMFCEYVALYRGPVLVVHHRSRLGHPLLQLLRPLVPLLVVQRTGICWAHKYVLGQTLSDFGSATASHPDRLDIPKIWALHPDDGTFWCLLSVGDYPYSPKPQNPVKMKYILFEIDSFIIK